MKRPVHYIVLHSTAVPAEKIIEHIKEYWKNERQFIHPGYHLIVSRSGSIETLLLEEKEKEKLRNRLKRSVHISYVSGVDANNNLVTKANEQQLHSLYSKVVELKERYPKAIVLGRFDNECIRKQNAKFEVRHWLQQNMQDFLLAA